MVDNNFGTLGSNFQKSLIKILFENSKFTTTIIDVIESKYFDGPYFKYIVENFKELYEQYGLVPTFETVKQKIIREYSAESQYNIHFDTLNDIISHKVDNEEWIKDVAINFCKQQVLKKEISKIQKIIEKGNFAEYNQIERIIQDALKVGNRNENINDIFDFEEALKENSRIPLPTGVSGLDKYFKGGLAKTELGIVIAPTGIGKELPNSEPILTPTGWIKNGELKVNDYVIGSDGLKQKVTGVYPQGIKPIYKITFSDDTFSYCGLEHLWSVSTIESRKLSDEKYITIKTSDMLNSVTKNNTLNYKLPLIKPINFFYQPIEKFDVKSIKKLENHYIYNTIETRKKVLDELSIIVEDAEKSKLVEHEELANNIREIILSLGHWAKIENNDVGYFVKYSKTKDKYIQNIEYSHNEEASCIMVENEDKLYVTRDYVLTHNTTLLTLFANSAYNSGFNVLQIFFEDNANNILKKHYTIWTGIAPDELYNKKEEVIETLNVIKNTNRNSLKLLKLPSDSVSVTEIKNHIRKLKSEGFIPDLIIIDYVDCIVPEKSNYNEEWKGEGAIMRSLEAMTTEFNVAMWVATQGNRASISSELVTTDQMGGSIKKAQIGHVVISVGKTLQQKNDKLATMTILKSRIGDDGIVFSNCKFDNEFIEIDTEDTNNLLGFKEDKAEQNKKYASELYIKRQERIKENNN